MMLRRLKNKGQVASEYGLVLSVLTIAVVAAAFVFVPTFQEGTSSLANDISTILDTQQINGMGGGGAGSGPGTTGNPGSSGSGSSSGQPSGEPNNDTSDAETPGGGNVSLGGGRGLEAPGFGGSNDSVTGVTLNEVANNAANPNEFIPPLGVPRGGISEGDAQWLVNAASEAGITDPQICSQYAIWLHAPGTLQQITEETVAQDLTRTGEMTIPSFHIPFFGGGFNFGGTTVQVTQGHMNLRGMQDYLQSKGQESSMVRNGTIDQLDQMVENGHSPIVIIDAKNGATNCNGLCGHTVTVMGVRNEGGVRTVVVKDAFGQYSIPADQFDRAWAQHGRKALDVPKRPYFYSSVENDIP